MSSNTTATAGHPFPLGATVQKSAVNFSLFTKNATAVELLLFDRYDDLQPRQVFQLDPSLNRTFYYWHLSVPGLQPGQIYAYRVDGPYAPEQGHRFNRNKVLLDPYAREMIYGDNWRREHAKGPDGNVATAIKCVVVDPTDYDWEGDVPLRRSFNETVIYELHVGGFTRHPSSGVSHPGTFSGVIAKIPYLRSLGITAIELLPVQQYDEQDVQDHIASSASQTARTGITNYWGYNPIGFFAPHRDYCVNGCPGQPTREFRDMVKALHKAGIEVILDVAFNHTAEGDHLGPTLSFRGLENRAYYLLDAEDKRLYSDYAGCGNTLNGNHSIVRRLIIDALHYWVEQMHVDGFRFDLASVLARDEWGRPMRSPPILWDIESDPRLVGTKIIAEASGTGVIATMCAAFSAETKAQLWTLRTASSAARGYTQHQTTPSIAASTLLPAMTDSHSTTWSHTARNTIRTTEKTIKTVPTRTIARITGTKAQRTIQIWSVCARGRSRTRWLSFWFRREHRCYCSAMRSDGRSVGTTTPTARTTTRAGSTGTRSGSTRACSVSHSA